MSVKGSRWSPEDAARLDDLRTRRWLASFADEGEALVYAWTHPGAFLAVSETCGDVRYAAFRRAEYVRK